MESRKSYDYYLIDWLYNIYTLCLIDYIVLIIIVANTNHMFRCRLIQLVLTLPVSTAMTKRALSAIKIFKIRLHNKVEDKFLKNSLIVYIKKEIAKKFTVDQIIKERLVVSSSLAGFTIPTDGFSDHFKDVVWNSSVIVKSGSI